MLGIILVNWKNWADTCECLASLANSTEQNFKVILIDNNSEDQSKQKIQQWADGELAVPVGPFNTDVRVHKMSHIVINYELNDDYIIPEITRNYRLIILQSPENVGFAKASNIGMRYCLKNDFEHIFLLNNDTTVEPDTLANMVSFLNNQTVYDVVTPLINYYHTPHVVWCLGGKLSFLGRRIHNYQDSNEQEIDQSVMSLKVEFVSGCALMARSEVFLKQGLFTEDFFFGEEDYDFSWRMQEQSIAMAALPNVKIYHKVGAARKELKLNNDNLAYMFIGYLNRFIDKKHHCKGRIRWELWRIVCMLYIVPKLFVIHRFSLLQVIRLTVRLIKMSSQNNQVDKKTFFWAKKYFNG